LTAQTQGHKTIEANAFVLTDQGGLPTAELSMSGGFPGLSIYGGKSKGGVLIAVGDDGPFLLMRAKAGKQGPSVSMDPDSITVQDRQGFHSVLGVTDTVTTKTGESHQTSAAALTMFDKDSNVIWRAP
jgi:hypothetical protein